MTSVASQLIDMVPNLPAGSLDKYREKSSFYWKQMRLAIEQPYCLSIKMKVWSFLESDPIFLSSPVTLSSDEEKRVTAKQLKKFLFSGLFDKIDNLSYQERTRYLMIVNEATEMVNPCLSIKFALGVTLFANALLCLGTERHISYYKDVWSGKILSCLAVTELGHGSDTKRLQTKATYDKATREFVINSPGIESSKCWVGNLGKQCTHALLFAQLVSENICYGLHAFIVPIRDPVTLLPYMNITIGDVGEKTGLHGIDNGFIMFHNYRIPRENLLNKTGDITEDGEYETQLADPQKVLGAALECLSAGRVAILHESCNNLTKAVVISIRYSAQRCQFSDSSGVEIPIIEYQTQQWRLFPYLSANFAIKAFVNKFTDQYINCVVQSRNGQMDVNQASQMVGGVHAIVCCSKALVTWICRDAIQESREACGGHGYHKAAGIGDLRNNHDPRVTFEGDNTVLLQQTTNWLIRQAKDRFQDYSFFPMTCIQFLEHFEDILSHKFGGITLSDVLSHRFISKTYEWLICWLLKSTIDQIELLRQDGNDCYRAKSQSQVYRGHTLALVFAESIILQYFWELCCSSNSELKAVLSNLYYLFGTWSIYKHIAVLYQGGFCHGPTLVELLSRAILELCEKLKPEAVSLVDAIAPPDSLLNSVLGSSDGNVYEKLMGAFKHYTGSLQRPSWWSEISLHSKL